MQRTKVDMVGWPACGICHLMQAAVSNCGTVLQNTEGSVFWSGTESGSQQMIMRKTAEYKACKGGLRWKEGWKW
jgi:hypothetical protein